MMTAGLKIHLLSLLLLVIMAGTMPIAAQRYVTPVTPGGTAKPAETKKDESKLLHKHDKEGNIVFVDTVTGAEYVDTTASSIPRMIYPLIYKASVGINVWDPLMRCFGQNYGVAGIWAELNMHNRYFPSFEVGLGAASISSEQPDYKYHSPLSPYFKIGASYNIFYNSNPDYQLLVGLHYGFTPFRYSVDDVTVRNPYWGTSTALAIPSHTATAGYVDVSVGVKVRVVSQLSIGWNFVLHALIHEGGTQYGQPIYIPGYGKRGNSFTGNLSVIWTIPLNNHTLQSVE